MWITKNIILYLQSVFLEQKSSTKMSAEAIKLVEEEYQQAKEQLPKFGAGDTVKVHVKIKEGDKERTQLFQGTVLQRRNGGNGETFTVRKISDGIAVERIFPAVSPNVEKVEVLRRGKVRRARLFYLRDRSGKGAKIKEKRTVKPA